MIRRMADRDPVRRPRPPRAPSGKPARPGRPTASQKENRPVRSTKRGLVDSPVTKRPGFFAGGVSFSLRALIVVIVASVALLVSVPVSLQWVDQAREYKAVEGELDEAIARRAELEKELENWESDEYVAAQARARLGFVQKGETQFSVTDAPENKKTREEERAEQGPPRPWTMVLQERLIEADKG